VASARRRGQNNRNKDQNTTCPSCREDERKEVSPTKEDCLVRGGSRGGGKHNQERKTHVVGRESKTKTNHTAHPGTKTNQEGCLLCRARRRIRRLRGRISGGRRGLCEKTKEEQCKKRRVQAARPKEQKTNQVVLFTTTLSCLLFVSIYNFIRLQLT